MLEVVRGRSLESFLEMDCGPLAKGFRLSATHFDAEARLTAFQHCELQVMLVENRACGCAFHFLEEKHPWSFPSRARQSGDGCCSNSVDGWMPGWDWYLCLDSVTLTVLLGLVICCGQGIYFENVEYQHRETVRGFGCDFD